MTDQNRTISFMFGYEFDSNDIDRIARACGVKPDDLTAKDLTEWVQDLITTELMSPDPLKDEEEAASSNLLAWCETCGFVQATYVVDAPGDEDNGVTRTVCNHVIVPATEETAHGD